MLMLCDEGFSRCDSHHRRLPPPLLGLAPQGPVLGLIQNRASGAWGQTPLPPATKVSGAPAGDSHRLDLGLFASTMSSCHCPSLSSSSPFLLLSIHPPLGNLLVLKHPNLPCFWPFLCCSFCLDSSDPYGTVTWLRAPVNATSFSGCPIPGRWLPVLSSTPFYFLDLIDFSL